MFLKRMKGDGGREGADAEVQGYVPPDMANPGNYIKLEEISNAVEITTGGGHLGWRGAHENEAPFPQELAEWFIRSLAPPGGIVVDPFSGSGTTVRAAEALGRRGIGFDLRRSQCELGIRGSERPHQPILRQSRKADRPMPLFREES